MEEERRRTKVRNSHSIPKLIKPARRWLRNTEDRCWKKPISCFSNTPNWTTISQKME
jgi:hypothetical protein